MKREFERHLAELAAEKKLNDDRLRSIAEQNARDLARMDERLAELAKEIAAARLYFGPMRWGTRYELYVKFEESYVQAAHSLMETGPMIVRVMSDKIAQALATIDFARVKREDPRHVPADRIPRMYIDAMDTTGLDTTTKEAT